MPNGVGRKPIIKSIIMEQFSTSVFCGLVGTFTMIKLLLVHVLVLLCWYVYNMFMMKDYSLWPMGAVAFI